jgi:hypothetical protein
MKDLINKAEQLYKTHVEEVTIQTSSEYKIDFGGGHYEVVNKLKLHTLTSDLYILEQTLMHQLKEWGNCEVISAHYNTKEEIKEEFIKTILNKLKK